jgi:erythronate-4-phosphate dehydrogenase
MKIVADENIPYVDELFGSMGTIRRVVGREVKRADVHDADILLVRSVTPVNRNLLENTSVKFVGTATIGTDHVDEEYLADAGIGFANAAGSNANSVAEYITAALLVLAERHNIHLSGKSIGVIGVGNVGSGVVQKAQALGMKVVRNDPPLARKTGDAVYRPIEEALDCDFVTLHVPLAHEGCDATWHMADDSFFAAMHDDAFFINSSRGAVVDEKALKRALLSGCLKGCVLDVWENEPDIDIELLDMVDLGTPHIAGYSLDGKAAGTRMIYEAACEFLGEDCRADLRKLLPEPPVPEICLEGSENVEDEVRRAVLSVYDIREDDARLRAVYDRPKLERGAYFDGLRKNYPVRREFYNTKVCSDELQPETVAVLSKIGFDVQ